MPRLFGSLSHHVISANGKVIGWYSNTPPSPWSAGLQNGIFNAFRQTDADLQDKLRGHRRLAGTAINFALIAVISILAVLRELSAAVLTGRLAKVIEETSTEVAVAHPNLDGNPGNGKFRSH